MANKKIPWKKILQAGAYATDAMSRGSAGGLGKAIVDSKIDLSGKGNAFDEQNTEDNAGKKAKKYGGQGNKRRNTSYQEIE